MASSFLFGMGSESPENLVERTERDLGSKLEAGTASTEDFLAVLRALADSKRPDAPLKAESWLRRLELEGIAVSSECYQRTIEAWAGTETEDPARVVTRAESWLQKAQNNPDESQRANTACFNAFLDVCTKGRAVKGSHGGGHLVRVHADLAERTLRFMIVERQRNGPKCRISPDIESFNLAIRGWNRCRKSLGLADRATNILHLLEQYNAEIDSRVESNSRTYGLIMDALSVKAKLKAKLCKQNQSNPMDPAKNGLEEINVIRSMIEAIHQRNDAADGSNTFYYNILLSCWANISPLHEIATTEVEDILQHMAALKDSGRVQAGPDATSYLMTMRTWCNCLKPNRGERVTWLLTKQWRDFEFSNDEALRPQVHAYNMCMRVWSDLGNPKEAEKILTEVIRLGDVVQPNSESFSYVIKAWLKLADRGSAFALTQAAQWMDKLMNYEKQETGILSSVDLYLSFLGSARYSAQNYPDVLGLCFDVFGELQKSRHTICGLHYSRLLQVALLALPKPDDDEVRYVVVERIIIECKEAGLVSGKLLKALSNGPVRKDNEKGWTVEASREAVEHHFPSWPLPAAWTRNLRNPDLEPAQTDLQRTNLTVKFYKLPGRANKSKQRSINRNDHIR